ncbi:MAG: HAMP domain-containing histidine kinase [Lachnospiraceae bacterium]|nr:HAMP domain-containing histidine kinase [Lachnospiraceae bacterium]
MKKAKSFKQRNLYLRLVGSYVFFLLMAGIIFLGTLAELMHIVDHYYDDFEYETLTVAQLDAMEQQVNNIISFAFGGMLLAFLLLSIIFAIVMGRRIRNEERAVEAARQKMLADISHDLKTPITVIQGYSKAIADGIVPEENREKYLNTIYQKSNHLADLINAFYDYSRLEHPQFRLKTEPGDLSEYLREYVAGKYEELELAGYELDVDIPEQPMYMPFDHLELRRVFENIISNTIKHNAPPTTLYVSMEYIKEKRHVRIRLGDDGSGIPEHLREHLFDPFVVGDESRNSKHGTGLGLSVARRVVEAHGGSIRLLEPEETSWSTMYEIVLPLNRGSV